MVVEVEVDLNYANTTNNPQSASPENAYGSPTPSGTEISVTNQAYPITVGAGGAGSKPSGPAGNCNSMDQIQYFQLSLQQVVAKVVIIPPTPSQPGTSGGSGGGGGSWPSPGKCGGTQYTTSDTFSRNGGKVYTLVVTY